MIILCVVIVSVAGAVGGAVNALLSDNGFILPKSEFVDGSRVLRPGVLGNTLIGAVAAAISWGLYGPAAASVLIGGGSSESPATLTLGAAIGALLVGIGGARWLSNEVDKRLYRAAAAVASAATPVDAAIARRLATARPMQAVAIARSLARPVPAEHPPA